MPSSVRIPKEWEPDIDEYATANGVTRHRAVLYLIQMGLFKTTKKVVSLPPERGKYQRRPK